MTKPAQYWKRVGEGIVERAPDQFLAQTWRGGPSKTFHTKALAKAWRRDAMAKRDRGEPVIVRRSTDTIGAECERWLDATRGYVSDASMKVYAQRVRCQINHPRIGLAKTKAADLSREDVENWARGLQREGFHVRTANEARSLLARILDAAINANPPRLGVNVARYARPLPMPRREPVNAPNLTHIFAVIDALPARCRIVAELALGAGLRFQEAAAVMPGDVHEDTLVLHVQRQRVKRSRGFKLPKGEKTRWVPIEASLVAKLHAHECEHGLSSAGTYSALAGGLPMSEYQWNKEWRKARAGAGVALSGVHQLRHAFGSHHVAAGESIPNVARWMGHASQATTMAYYVHAVADARPATDLLARPAANARKSRTNRALKVVS